MTTKWNEDTTKTSSEVLKQWLMLKTYYMTTFFGDIVDTPKEGSEQHKKRECLKGLIDRGKLGHKWTHERVDKASDEIINKTYAQYKQRQLNEKGEKTAKALYWKNENAGKKIWKYW